MSFNKLADERTC